ncbi:MAG: hypothetical protein PWP11_3339, partial [Thauera sp.]|nr:hypothetical protein [Thauera sp.]
MSNTAPPKASSTSEGMVETEQQSPESTHAAIRTVALLLMRHEIRNLRRWFEEFDRDILLPILLGEIAMHNTGAFEHASANGNGGRNGRPEESLPSPHFSHPHGSAPGGAAFCFTRRRDREGSGPRA